MFSKKWNYSYDDKCECSDDDRCGCSFPNNLPRSYESSKGKSARSVYEYNHARVGEQAVNFVAPAVLADDSTTSEFNFFDYISGNYALLMFYLADFSAVCPKDIINFNQANDEFIKRGIKVLAVSVDPLPAHIAWRKAGLAEGGIGHIHYPLVSDINKTASLAYGILRTDGLAQRASFLIDKNYTIRYQAVYDEKIERNVSETMRVIDKMVELDKADCRGLDCFLTNKQALPEASVQ